MVGFLFVCMIKNLKNLQIASFLLKLLFYTFIFLFCANTNIRLFVCVSGQSGFYFKQDLLLNTDYDLNRYSF